LHLSIGKIHSTGGNNGKGQTDSIYYSGHRGGRPAILWPCAQSLAATIEAQYFKIGVLKAQTLLNPIYPFTAILGQEKMKPALPHKVGRQPLMEIVENVQILRDKVINKGKFNDSH